MHAVVRNYTGKGAKELFDLLEQRKADVEKIMRSVKGFQSYALVRTADGGFSISVYEDKAGTEESSKRAADWVKQNASGSGVGAPQVSQGSVIVQFK